MLVLIQRDAQFQFVSWQSSFTHFDFVLSQSEFETRVQRVFAGMRIGMNLRGWCTPAKPNERDLVQKAKHMLLHFCYEGGLLSLFKSIRKVSVYRMRLSTEWDASLS